MCFREINSEVFVADGPLVRVSHREIEFLKERVKSAPRGRVRLCAHPGNDDALHEMFIVLSCRTYIRPHRHINKSESFHVIEGTVDVVLFDEPGEVADVISMGDFASGKKFYYRIMSPLYHTLLITSEVLVFHETTNGPFKQDGTDFAPWSPEEADAIARARYVQNLVGKVKALSSSRGL